MSLDCGLRMLLLKWAENYLLALCPVCWRSPQVYAFSWVLLLWERTSWGISLSSSPVGWSLHGRLTLHHKKTVGKQTQTNSGKAWCRQGLKLPNSSCFWTSISPSLSPFPLCILTRFLSSEFCKPWSDRLKFYIEIFSMASPLALVCAGYFVLWA